MPHLLLAQRTSCSLSFSFFFRRNDISGSPSRGASTGVSPPRRAHSFKKKGKKKKNCENSRFQRPPPFDFSRFPGILSRRSDSRLGRRGKTPRRVKNARRAIDDENATRANAHLRDDATIPATTPRDANEQGPARMDTTSFTRRARLRPPARVHSPIAAASDASNSAIPPSPSTSTPLPSAAPVKALEVSP